MSLSPFGAWFPNNSSFDSNQTRFVAINYPVAIVFPLEIAKAKYESPAGLRCPKFIFKTFPKVDLSELGLGDDTIAITILHHYLLEFFEGQLLEGVYHNVTPLGDINAIVAISVEHPEDVYTVFVTYA